MTSGTFHRDERPRQAWLMRQKVDSRGRHLHTWADIADAVGYDRPVSAQVAAGRYEKGQAEALEGDKWEREMPWKVPLAQKHEYIYRSIVLRLKHRAGVRLDADEQSRLDRFLEALADPPAVVLFDEQEGKWFTRARREGDEDVFVRE